MTDLFRVVLLVGTLLYVLLIFYLMKKGRINLKYSLVWFFSGAALLICAIFPGIIRVLTDLMGIYSDTNAVFLVGVVFLLLIILSLTSIVSGLSDRLKTLIQTQAMLEKRVRELENVINKSKED